MDRVKLAALDQEDLAIVSAHVQDAVLLVGDIRYLPQEGKAVFVMNRFVWDKPKDPKSGTHERRRAALAFSRVRAMKSAGIRQTAKDAVLSLLAVSFRPEPGRAEGEEAGPDGEVLLTFSGGGTIALHVECIEAQLADLGAAWSTANRPEHPLD
ncbi:DUF2948 family protein [Microvirga tunisiensis]|uniref:DUF2948 family protein n=1 Tax=Pannonibacter tanglangensis TaxID=2750084 RepID=A0A7X5F4K4_9HYPH|nr:DUF2948 family protein [Pannonibacter sp. XCT-53]NBN78655.1 DUF2948 family protein [Pannonibacter sp. XCT-53]